MRLTLTLAVLLYAAPVLAQTGAPTSWTLRVYAPGGQSALSTLSVTAAQVACNQPFVSSTAPVTNPTLWAWDDPFTSGRECRYDDATRLTALPDGAYEATAQAINSDGTSPETARVPFIRRRPNPPPAPTGLRFIRPATP
jgi:hypothetical protein